MTGTEAAPAPPRAAADAGSRAVAAARRSLLADQKADGHWVGELEGDTILESEFVLLWAFLGKADDPRVAAAARYLLERQLPEGGWPNYPGGPAEVSVSVKAYLALKVAGYPAAAPPMRHAAGAIRAAGGPTAVNSFTRFYLALLGQIPFDNCPAVPPEMVLLPRWFHVNVYAMSAWSRTIFVPLSIVWAIKPVRPLPPERGIRELYEAHGIDPDAPRPACVPSAKRWTWTNFFLGVDRLIKRCERWNLLPLRRVALRRALAWVREHGVDSDGVGAIFPPMVYTLILLSALGKGDGDPEFDRAVVQLEGLMIAEGDTLRLQPCLSPVWDTALTTIALADSGLPGDAPPVRAATDWLLAREVRRAGDWAKTVRAEPGGWCFEYANSFYPDTDDTAMVLIALARAGRSGEPAVRRGVAWLLAMQNRDGGWAAFDRDIDRQILERVPFADHNAMLDPSCPDIAARVMEALGHHGFTLEHPAMRRGLAFVRDAQEDDGSFKGRWGVNYIYGTWQVLQGLAACGMDVNDPLMARAARWLRRAQNPDGGWGESCASYDDPALAGQGPSTASQTAWALLGLAAAGDADTPEAAAGERYLLQTQRPDGTWAEAEFTGTGFPKVFYLKYHMYPRYFPLMALSRLRAARS